MGRKKRKDEKKEKERGDEGEGKRMKEEEEERRKEGKERQMQLSFIEEGGRMIEEETEGDLLFFARYSGVSTRKHVHGLHPFKGKFIPQLAEYFLGDEMGRFKERIYFKRGDLILDPFCGSGTTLVVANELGLHAIGIDVCAFNVLLSNVKIRKYDLKLLGKRINEVTEKLSSLRLEKEEAFEEELKKEAEKFNTKYFPVNLRRKLDKGYIQEKEKEFRKIYLALVDRYEIDIDARKSSKSFLETWYPKSIRKELEFLAEEIKRIKEEDIRDFLFVLLSRTARTCRATTHSDLATLKEPVFMSYYCKKHRKICSPLFSIKKKWKLYSIDALLRVKEFDKLRTDTYQLCLEGDSRNIDLVAEVSKRNKTLASIIEKKGIRGIMTSPPYVGLINYHEQHAYAYELIGLERKDHLEIGSLDKGQNKLAIQEYVTEISTVFKNLKKYLAQDYDIFLVANDRFNLYPEIAEKVGMRICKQTRNIVIRRAEINREPYFENVLHLKEK